MYRNNSIYLHPNYNSNETNGYKKGLLRQRPVSIFLIWLFAKIDSLFFISNISQRIFKRLRGSFRNKIRNIKESSIRVVLTATLRMKE